MMFLRLRTLNSIPVTVVLISALAFLATDRVLARGFCHKHQSYSCSCQSTPDERTRQITTQLYTTLSSTVTDDSSTTGSSSSDSTVTTGSQPSTIHGFQIVQPPSMGTGDWSHLGAGTASGPLSSFQDLSLEGASNMGTQQYGISQTGSPSTGAELFPRGRPWSLPQLQFDSTALSHRGAGRFNFPTSQWVAPLPQHQRLDLISRTRKAIDRIRQLEKEKEKASEEQGQSYTSTLYRKLLTDSDWLELGIDRDSFLVQLPFIDENALTLVRARARLSQRATEAESRINPEEAEPRKREQDELSTGSDQPSDTDLQLAEQFQILFGSLMQLLQNLAGQHEVVLVSPSWNPHAFGLCTQGSVLLHSLIGHITGNYDHHDRNAHRIAPVCRGSSLQTILSVLQPSGRRTVEPNIRKIDGSVATQSLLGDTLTSLAGHIQVTLIHLTTGEGDSHDTVILLSDGSNYWFGSQHLGAYHSFDMQSVIRFLRGALRLMMDAFNVQTYDAHCKYL